MQVKVIFRDEKSICTFDGVISEEETTDNVLFIKQNGGRKVVVPMDMIKYAQEVL